MAISTQEYQIYLVANAGGNTVSRTSFRYSPIITENVPAFVLTGKPKHAIMAGN